MVAESTLGGVAASLLHLVRHGEVHNPGEVLYGRIEGFGLSELGVRMADAAAASIAQRPVSALYASPLQRAQESAAPFVERFGVQLHTDPRLIEPWNRFEGGAVNVGPALLRRPATWPWLVNPWKPSWGEPYREVAARMIAAIDAAWDAASGGDVVMVSHQLPIAMVQRAVAGLPLHHDPRARRCSLSSITTLMRNPDAAAGAPRYTEVSYREPAADLLAASVDRGAV